MKTNFEKLASFTIAKKIALTIGKNQYKRARYNNQATNYIGANVNGRMFVIGESTEDIQNPDCLIEGKPAREVFGNFSIMYKK